MRGKGLFQGFAIFAILLIGSACNGQESDKSLENKEYVENSLTLQYYIAGEEPERFTIYERMEEYNVPGLSIAVINNGSIEWVGNYGIVNTSDSLPVSETTIFQAASISKPVAAIAVLMLVEEGLIDLDEDVNEYLTTWSVPDNRHNRNEKVTLRRLLNHTSGLTVHGFPGYSVNDSLPSVHEILNGEYPSNTGKVYADTKPGSLWRYSGGGYTVLQQIIAEVTGRNFVNLMEETIFSSLDMNSSTYEQPLPDERVRDASSGHLHDGSVIPGKWHLYPEKAAAGLWTTPSDLARLAIELQHSINGNSEKLITQETAELMLTRGVNNWGLGFSIGGSLTDPFFSHGGANHGFRALFIAYAYSGRGVVIMTNSDNGGDLIPEILRAVSFVYDWPDFKPQPLTIE